MDLAALSRPERGGIVWGGGGCYLDLSVEVIVRSKVAVAVAVKVTGLVQFIKSCFAMLLLKIEICRRHPDTGPLTFFMIRLTI